MNDLIVPIYIDTTALLDLWASIEGGFSTVEKVTTRTAATQGSDKSIKADTGAEVGAGFLSNILKLNINYSSDWKKAQDKSQEKQVERYHTYGSLFFNLLGYLNSNNIVKRLDSDQAWKEIGASDFVELRGKWQMNPLANSFAIIERFINMALLFGNLDSEQMKPPKNSQNKEAMAQYENIKKIENIKSIISGMVEDTESGRVRTFVINDISPIKYRAVTWLFLDYLRDETMKEINYKEYRVLGKVVRKVENTSGEAIELLLGSGLGAASKPILDQLISAVQQIPQINLPKIETEIKGPALEIVPIAVYI